MRTLKFSSTLLASLAAAGALAGGILFAPPASADGVFLSAQDQPQRKPFNVTGVALLPDGQPAVKFPVEIKVPNKVLQNAGGDQGGGQAPPPDLLSQAKGGPGDMQKTVAKGVTDDSGRFTLKVQPINGNVFYVTIGDKLKSPWIDKPHQIKEEGKDVDLGNIQLSPKVGRG